jgi:hypothetical protein
MPIRIYDIAKKLGLENKDVLAKAKEMGMTEVRGPSSPLAPAGAMLLEAALSKEVAEDDASGLRSVSLGNFKAFGAAQTVPLRPITLVFGSNSSGKSSLIHGLLLAHNGLETGELDTFKTVLGGEAVDLGGFRQYVYRRNADAFTEFGAEMAVARLPRGLRALLPQGAKTLSVEVRWGVPVIAEVDGKPIAAMPEVRTCDFLLDEKPLLRFFRRLDGRFQLKEVGQEAFRTGLEAMILAGTTVEAAHASDIGAAGRAFAEFAGNMQFEGGGCLPGALVAESVAGPEIEVPLQAISKGAREDNLRAAFQLFAPRLVTDMLEKLKAAVRREFRRVAYLGPLRSFPPRHVQFGDARDTNWVAGGGSAWDTLRREEEVRNRVNAWLSDSKRLSTPFEISLRRHVASADLEPLLEEEFQSVQTAPPEDDPAVYRYSVNRYREYTIPPDLLKRLETGEISKAEYHKLVTQMGERGELEVSEEKTEFPTLDFDPRKAAANTLSRIHTELDTIDDLGLVDKRTNTPVSHRDVGIGISQVLPVLVHAYADKGKVVAIEQPEIHLHPALQAELGDVFIESALGENKNTFLLETHSEHLILRILRRVRETTEGKLPAGATPVRPEDVSVVFIEPTPKGAVVHYLPVTPDGDFGAPWPGGFFAERFQDLP